MTIYTLTESERIYLMEKSTDIRTLTVLESLQPNTQEPVTKEMAYAIGAKGAEPTEAERLLFEEWMRGHCWAVIGEWTGTQYLHPKEAKGFLHEGAVATRRLWAAWRDRAALGAPQPASTSGLNPLWVATHPDNLQQPAEPLELTTDEIDALWKDEPLTMPQIAVRRKIVNVALKAANAKRKP
jgi:hypothetical protein